MKKPFIARTKWQGSGLIYRRDFPSLVREARDLVAKGKFLVHRSEFLHQQGLLFNNHAQELLRDSAVVGENVSRLGQRLDEIELALRTKPKSKRKAKRK